MSTIHQRTRLACVFIAAFLPACIEVRQPTSNSDSRGDDAVDTHPDQTGADGEFPDMTVGTDAAVDSVAAPDVPGDATTGDVVEDPPWRVLAIGGLGQTYLRGGRLQASFDVRLSALVAPNSERPLRNSALALFRADDDAGPGAWTDTQERCTTNDDGECSLRYRTRLAQEQTRFAVTRAGGRPEVDPTVVFDTRADVPLSLAAGPNHSCLRTAAGKLYCWGWNGPEPQPGAAGPFARPMTGFVDAGVNTSGQYVPVDGDVLALGAGGEAAGGAVGQPGSRRGSTCVVTTAGALGDGTFCTGSGMNGLLGSQGTIDRDTWTPVETLVSGNRVLFGPASALSAGTAFMCAIAAPLAESDISCWGANDSSQLGPGATVAESFANSARPVGFPALVSDGLVTGLATGSRHACATIGVAAGMAGARAYCWGSNQFAQLGMASFPVAQSLAPVAWPATTPVPCGANAVPNAAMRAKVEKYARFDAIVGGGDHTCATVTFPGVPQSDADSFALACMPISEQGMTRPFTFCTGRNDVGQRGQATTGADFNWVLNELGIIADGFVRLAAGRDFTCGVTAMGDLFCWGSNEFGQLGYRPDKDAHATPTLIARDFNPTWDFGGGRVVVKDVVAGPDHVCVIEGQAGEADFRDIVLCWGRNDRGQAGGRCGDDGVAAGVDGCWALPTRVSFD